MAADEGQGASRRGLLVYYSASARQCLETALRRWCREVFALDGRASDATDSLRSHPAEVVVIDQGAGDVSINQAVRQVGMILPGSLVLTVAQDGQEVQVYLGGRRIAVAPSLDAALTVHGGKAGPLAAA
jgi:hypothetical protein